MLLPASLLSHIKDMCWILTKYKACSSVFLCKCQGPSSPLSLCVRGSALIWQELRAQAPGGADQLTCGFPPLPPNYYRKQQLLQCK